MIITASEIATRVEQGTAVNLVAAACLTVLIYDHCLTLDDEIEHIWPSRLSIAKILFLTNRYLVEGILLFDCISASRTFLSDDFCVFYLRWLTIASTVSTSTVQGILVLRVWALQRRNKWALGTAFFFYFGGVVTLVGLVIRDYVGESVFIDTSLRGLPGCYATSVPAMIAGFWIGPLIVESVLFFLVVSRAVAWWKDGAEAPRILTVLARDSTIYFAVVFALLLANYLLFSLGPPFLSSLLVTPSAVAGCIIGSHMLLNLRTIHTTNAATSLGISNLDASRKRPSNPQIGITRATPPGTLGPVIDICHIPLKNVGTRQAPDNLGQSGEVTLLAQTKAKLDDDDDIPTTPTMILGSLAKGLQPESWIRETSAR